MSSASKPFDPTEVIKTHPAFISDLDPSVDNPAIAALQALKYESESPNESALSYKDEGNYHYKRKEFRKAIDSYTGGLLAKPTDGKLLAVLFTNRAICHWNLENYRACIRDCKSAISADPTHLKAYTKAVDACLKLEKAGECLELCEQGIAQFPDCRHFADAQLIALQLQVKSEKAVAIQAEAQRKKDEKTMLTFAMIRSHGVSINTRLPPLDIPEAAGAQFYVDPSNRCHWSLLFMYPEFGQTDFLRDVVETSTVLDCLRIVFDPDQPPPSWDRNLSYASDLSALEVYFEDTRKSQQFVSFNPKISLRKLTRRSDFSIRRDLLVILHVVSKKSTNFYDRWKAELR